MRIVATFTRWSALLAVLTTTLFMLAPPQSASAQGPTEVTAVNAPLGSAFTYQGRLDENNKPADGDYDFQFILYDAVTGGNQRGETVLLDDVPVSKGLFSVALNFGQAAFTGDALFLEMGVRPASARGAYTLLSPRTALTAAPYALGMPGVADLSNINAIKIDGDLHMTRNDFVMLPTETGDGGRAVVHGGNDTLVLNYGYDFAGGTIVASPLNIHGNLSMSGIDFVMGPNERGDGGRAMVHWENDALVLNFAKDFAGGVFMGGPVTVDGNVLVHNGNFIDLDGSLAVPDYVFEPDYPLMPLDELGAYVGNEKHLPGVPSQAEIHRDGLNLSEFHMRLLEKVEELTLYTLAQQEQIDAQQEQIETLAARLAALER